MKTNSHFALWIGTAVLLGVVIVEVPKAEAAPGVTFYFDWADFHPHNAPFNLTPGPWGTLTLTDSVVDPNRVDVRLVATPHPAYAAGLFEQFYLNFKDPKLDNHNFFFVAQNEAPGADNVQEPYEFVRIGSTGYTNSNIEFANFRFDINVVPSSDSLTVLGSLALYNRITDDPVDLNYSDFIYLSAGVGSPQASQAYAAYRTHVTESSDPDFPNGEFWAFATTLGDPPVANLPEPSTFALLCVGLAGLKVARRRKNRIAKA